MISLFPLPVRMKKRLNALRRNFSWKDNKEKSAFQLVKLKKIKHQQTRRGTENAELEATKQMSFNEVVVEIHKRGASTMGQYDKNKVW